jgi:hypothetical protein
MKNAHKVLNLIAVYAGHTVAADLCFFFLIWKNFDWEHRLNVLDFIFPFLKEWMLMKEFLCDTGSSSGLKRTIVFIGVLVLFLTNIAGMIFLMVYALFIEDSIWKGFCYSFIFTGFLIILIAILAAIIGNRQSEELIINELRPYSR